MKKSERYYLAMLAVVDSSIGAKEKVEIVEMLISDKSLAEYVEKCAEGKGVEAV